MFKYEIGFIGGGNMAAAMIERFIESKIIMPETILVCDNHDDKLEKFSKINCHITKNIIDVIKTCKITFIAVKPQSFNVLQNILKDNVGSEAIISIIAGKNISSIKEIVGNDCSVIVRIMPNLACRYGEGVTLADLSYADVCVKAYLKKLLETLGLLVEIPEKDFNFCSSISGCGPAFFFEYFKYFLETCLDYGLCKEQAIKMVLQTAMGSAKLALSNPMEDFNNLIANVCSKGGSTIEGVKIIEQSNMGKIVKDMIYASKKRNDELESL